MSRALRTSEERREFEYYVQALFESGSDAQVISQLRDLDVPMPYRLRVKVLYSPGSPASHLTLLAEKKEIRSLRVGSRIFALPSAGRTAARNHAFFIISSFSLDIVSEKVQALVSVSTSDEWKTVRRFVNAQYPNLVPVLLSQTELIQGARSLRSTTGHEVRVRSFSAKELVPEAGRKGRRSVREWTDEELDRALVSIQDRRQVITSLELDFFPSVAGVSHVRPKASCRIRKTGEIEVTGSFGIVLDAVVTRIAAVGERKLRLLSGRGLRESQYHAYPLAINFTRPVFENLETVRALVEILRRYPHSMHAVEHGNPYAHVKMTDAFDGSSFEVWALPPKRVVLMPGLKASGAAFERLVHHIFDAFREGELASYGRDREKEAIPS